MATFRMLAAALIGIATTAHAPSASSASDHGAHHPAAAVASAAAPRTDGEVRKVDKDQRKITLKHGPIANLDMPGMTMVFRVADPKMLDGLKPGDKVRFAADNVKGALTVTAIEPASR